VLKEPVGPSRFSPADNPALDEFLGSLVPKSVNGAPARIGQQIRAHVILAEKFDEGAERRSAIGDEVVEAGSARDHSKPLLAASFDDGQRHTDNVAVGFVNSSGPFGLHIGAADFKEPPYSR
jgi:hypothetical protein